MQTIPVLHRYESSVMKTKTQWLARCFMLPIALSFLTSLSYTTSEIVAQEIANWSAPVDLAAGRTGQNIFPTMLADAAGGVHVFWDEVNQVPGGNQITVNYAYWDGSGWSEPLDVFVGSAGPLAMGAQAVIDDAGIMHTVWIDDRGLMYAQRHVGSPVSATSWINRQLLPAQSGGRIGPVTIDQDEQGVLHVVYLHQLTDLPGVFHMQSTDGGTTWSNPVPLSDDIEFIEPEGRQRYYLDLLAVDGTLHVVWVQPENTLSYVRSSDGGTTWSRPRRLPGGIWPNLAALDDQLIAIFYTGSAPGNELVCLKLQTVSANRGSSWSAPQDILNSQVRGCLGRINVVQDSQGGNHLVVSAYQDLGTDVERIWTSQQTANNWTAPSVVTWEGVEYEALGRQPDFPSAAVAAGNVLHVVFHTDDGRIWHTQRDLAAAPLSPITYPTPALVLTPDTTPAASESQGTTVTPSETPLPAPVAAPPLSVGQTPPGQLGIDPTLVGVAAGTAVIVLVILLTRLRRGR